MQTLIIVRNVRDNKVSIVLQLAQSLSPDGWYKPPEFSIVIQAHVPELVLSLEVQARYRAAEAIVAKAEARQSAQRAQFGNLPSESIATQVDDFQAGERCHVRRWASETVVAET